MLLKKLIKNLPQNIKNIKIKGISLDSRKVKKGDIFFAIKGREFNGNLFIRDAILKGAVAVVCSKNLKKQNTKIPLIKAKYPKTLLASVCEIFFSGGASFSCMNGPSALAIGVLMSSIIIIKVVIFILLYFKKKS